MKKKRGRSCPAFCVKKGERVPCAKSAGVNVRQCEVDPRAKGGLSSSATGRKGLSPINCTREEGLTACSTLDWEGRRMSHLSYREGRKKKKKNLGPGIAFGSRF